MNPYTLTELALCFLKLGTLGFGGPIALAGYMQRDLVERRGWISKEDYLDGLALAQLAPGPLAAQLAMYLGWVKGRTWGATVIGVAFVAPSFAMVLALSAAYLRFGGLSWMQGAFYGIGAAVIALIGRSAWKLIKLTLARDRLLWAIFGVLTAATAWAENENIWLFLGSGVVVLLWRARRAPVPTAAAGVAPWLLSGLTGPASWPLLGKMAWFFTTAGAVVFGSGLAIVPFLHGGVVKDFGWLNEQQFLDAVAVAMITPGPVVITVAFIGYLVAGPVGALVAALAVFLPCYLFVVIPAPYFRRYGKNRHVKGFVDGVSAAATGAIAGATLVLGRRALLDAVTNAPKWPAVLLCAVTAVALWRVKKLPEPLVIAAAGVAGIAAQRL
ncbi:MAG: chromate transporter [Myxococcaceae bacterium]